MRVLRLAFFMTAVLACWPLVAGAALTEECISEASAQAQQLKHLTASDQAGQVLAVLDEISRILIECGADASEMANCQPVIQRITTEVEKYEKQGKALNGSFYARELKNELASFTTIAGAEPHTEVPPQTRDIQGPRPSNKPEQSDSGPNSVRVLNETQATFPMGEFRAPERNVDNLTSILELRNLKTRVESLERTTQRLREERSGYLYWVFLAATVGMALGGFAGLLIGATWLRRTSLAKRPSQGRASQGNDWPTENWHAGE